MAYDPATSSSIDFVNTTYEKSAMIKEEGANSDFRLTKIMR
jgi:hypothetical protein